MDIGPSKSNFQLGAWKKFRRKPLLIVAVVGSLILVPIVAIVFFFGLGMVGWQQALRTENMAAAVQTIERIRTFQAQYASRNKGRFATFDELIRQRGLAERFSGERPIVDGYAFTMVVEPGSANKPSFYSISADPVVENRSRHFYADSSLGVIKFTDENRPAKADDPAI